MRISNPRFPPLGALARSTSPATTRKILKMLKRGLAKPGSRLNAILSQTSDIAAHHDSYAELATLTNRRIAIIRNALLDAEAGKSDSATQDAYTHQIVDVADQIKESLEQLETHEQQFADAGRIVSERLFSAIVWLLVCAFILSLALLYMNYRLLLQELAERRRAERSAVDSQETLRLLQRALDPRARRAKP